MRIDPGDCLVCGAPHCSCGGGPVLVEQLPATAAQLAASAAPAPAAAPLVAETVQATLPAGQFTSGTYRRRKK
jgi:hypothetical protein